VLLIAYALVHNIQARFKSNFFIAAGAQDISYIYTQLASTNKHHGFHHAILAEVAHVESNNL